MIALTEELLATAKQNEISLSDAGASAGETADIPDDELEAAWGKKVGRILSSYLFSLPFYVFRCSPSVILPQNAAKL